MPPKTVSRFPAGSVEIPPSKSVSHRALICAALSEGESVLENIGDSRDISATLECLKALGARFRRVGNALVCRGTGGALVQARSALDCDESGSTLRFLLPVAALCAGETRFSGGGRLISRPLGPFEKEFPKHGAVLRAEGGGLTVRGPLTPGVFTLPGDVSSQFVTGLLFALPLLGGDSEIAISSPLESRSYVDLTLSCLGAFGIEIDNYKYEKFTVRGNQRFAPHNFRVEGDYSQAAFFLVAGAL
ncbi:MAG: 3-phosphoshikimate 1-carboxyvinyltransferase, partial [Oscillospiraceae bacterium]|nr:3-phosphoshikimate 1-carboxyvinyltransferase [Oscillospiraceae bacterium]